MRRTLISTLRPKRLTIPLPITLTLRVVDFPVDEFVTVISGKLILTVTGDEPQHFEVGDSVLIPKGFTGTWEMQGNYRELLVIMNEGE